MTASPSAAGPEAPAKRSGLVVAVLAFCGIVVALMQTLVVPLIPDLPRLLGTSASDASWVITATLLAAAVCNPVSGRLGDLYGKRRVMLASLLLMVAGSVVCAVSSGLVPVVAGRVLQGCAIGVIPLGISIMRDELPPEKLGSAMALMSATLGVGGAIGLPLAAFVAEHASWKTLFWMSAGLGALNLLLVLLLIPESPLRAGGRFDVPGAIGLTAGLSCLLLAISKGGDWGWGSGVTLGLFAAAAVVLVGWAFMELRVRDPLVDLRTTVRRQVLLTNLASILMGFAMFGMSLVLPTLLQSPRASGYGLDLTLFQAGLCLAPGGLMMMLLSPLSARVSRQWGPKIALMLGALVITVGYAAALGLMGSAWEVVLASSVIAAGVGLAYSAMPALIMTAVPASETAAANGLNALMRSIGTSTASAVISVLLAHMTVSLGTFTLPSLRGLQVALIVAAGAGVLGLLITGFIPGRGRSVPGRRQERLARI
ncbi:MFS transporter [Sphaerisporangium siamense]|uniref:EmrB/QacA subfamily drug resistance transporter n=1 Tax=Sphaerisporangium siamense TaxID=795645 RepID=A0A7W7DDN1_9ACTN|nr:MFS transporter [Sphaerisporangium siamense]MBB4704893.1 EmrB/QacA subfamily drug resistance transporter [Sphaerisporangium siamense]GII83695.1 MFS transporter [Sphaerisporangium siamense]